jgi:hypothetical protein
MKIDTTTPSGRGQFRRKLRKINAATTNMRRAHSGMYRDRFCDRRRFQKWKAVYDSWMNR